MQYFPAALQNLADQFARLPGIGGKTAQRLAFHVLGLPEEAAQDFADAINIGKADAVLAASLFHFGEIRISDLKDYLANEGIPVRRLS